VSEITGSEIRNDGTLINALTGMGQEGYDKTLGVQVGLRAVLQKQQLEDLAANWICRNIINAYPREATREWLEITLGGSKADQKTINDFNVYHDRLKIREKFRRAQYLANLYRGAVIVILADDGLDPKEPLKKDKIKTIKGLEVLDCHKIWPDITNNIPDPSEPEHYRLNVTPNQYPEIDQAKTQLIHASRIIRFDGAELPPDAMLRSNPPGWGLSLLELVWDAFADYETVYNSVSNMAADFNVFKMAMKDLAVMIKAGGNQAEEALRNRFKAIRQMMSVMKGIIVDADKEQVDFISRQFAGVADIMDRFTQRLVGATDLPYTYIFGRGQAGLNAQGTGDSEDKMMAKKTSQFQEDVFRPRFQYLGELIWLAKDGPTKGKLPEDWGFQFKSLLEETDTEKIAARLQAAQAYNTYVSMGVLLPEEVRNSQFGGDEYSIEIKLDEKLWKKKQEEQMGGGFGDFGGFGGGGDLGAEGGFGSGTETVPEDEQQEDIAQEEQNQEEAAPKTDSVSSEFEQRCRDEARKLTKQRFVLDSVVSRVWEKNKYEELLENGKR
jgi:uncharacterized protein